MTHCDRCGAETSNGLNLCEACRIAVTTYLEFLPVYYRNLARRRRPGRPNGTLGASQQWLLRRGETEGSQVEPALTRAFTTMTEWVEKLGHAVPQGDTEADTFTVLCELLEDSINRIDNPGRFVRAVARHEQALRTLTETVIPGWYAGACQQPSGRDMEGNQHVCGANTYVVPGLTWVTCRRCGATTHASAHVDVVLDEARDWVAPPMRLAEAVVQLVDNEHSIPRLYERIKKWGQRGRLDSIRPLDQDGDPYGQHRHRLGDVLDLLTREGPSYDVTRIYLERRARITGEVQMAR